MLKAYADFLTFTNCSIMWSYFSLHFYHVNYKNTVCDFCIMVSAAVEWSSGGHREKCHIISEKEVVMTGQVMYHS